MKGTIILVSLISAAIIFSVLFMSAVKENPDKYTDHDRIDSSYVPADQLDLNIVIVTSEPNFWDRVAALKATEAPAETELSGYAAVTDEEGNPVTDENGSIVTEPSESDENGEAEEMPVTTVPENTVRGR